MHQQLLQKKGISCINDHCRKKVIKTCVSRCFVHFFAFVQINNYCIYQDSIPLDRLPSLFTGNYHCTIRIQSTFFKEYLFISKLVALVKSVFCISIVFEGCVNVRWNQHSMKEPRIKKVFLSDSLRSAAQSGINLA